MRFLAMFAKRNVLPIVLNATVVPCRMHSSSSSSFEGHPLQTRYKQDWGRGSGGYSNLGARGKNFQKFMLSEKKKRSDLGLDIFLPKSKCSLKKKKNGC